MKRKREYKAPMYTNFFYAYEQFKKTPDYDRALRMLINLGMKMPYADNWIHGIFSLI